MTTVPLPEKRVLLDFEVEAHGCLPPEIDSLVAKHPRGDYEVTIRNLAVEPGVDRPLLSMHLVLPGDDLEAAKIAGESALRSFLRYLTVVTQLSFKIHELKKVVDWTLGKTGRNCLQYLRQPGYGLPLPAIQPHILESLRVLQNCETDATIDRAIRWFSSGVSARFSDDQFQFFWLVVELIASVRKDPGRVHDACPICRAPLYCETCDSHPTHRPYPRQAIEQLFVRFIPEGGGELFEKMSKIRHAIMHGGEVLDVVEGFGEELQSLVDRLGRIAWHSLVEEMLRRHPSPPGDQIRVFTANTFGHPVYRVCAHIVVYGADPENPIVDRLSMPEVTLVYGDDKPKNPR